MIIVFLGGRGDFTLWDNIGPHKKRKKYTSMTLTFMKRTPTKYQEKQSGPSPPMRKMGSTLAPSPRTNPLGIGATMNVIT
jgi:hypothetical protein